MKKSLSIYGVITGFIAVMAFVFKALHWPGGGMTCMAATVFTIIFLLFWGNHLCKNSENSKSIVWFNMLFLILATLAVMFRVLLWPGSSEMIMCTGALAVIDLIIMLIYYIRK